MYMIQRSYLVSVATLYVGIVMVYVYNLKLHNSIFTGM